MPLADYQQLVDSMVRDQSSAIKPADRDRAIGLALVRYSTDCERVLTEDLTWSAPGFLGPIPEGWTDGAWLHSAEYPIGLQPPAMIDLAYYVEAPDVQRLASQEALPSGAVVRVSFAAPHVLAGGAAPADTVPVAHKEALASYAAMILCRQLSTYFSGQREAAMGSDKSDTDTRARNFAQRAKEYRAAYYSGIGKADPQADKGGASAPVGDPAASVSSWAGRPRSNLTRGALL
jgi:hypothetical protein